MKRNNILFISLLIIIIMLDVFLKVPIGLILFMISLFLLYMENIYKIFIAMIKNSKDYKIIHLSILIGFILSIYINIHVSDEVEKKFIFITTQLQEYMKTNGVPKSLEDVPNLRGMGTVSPKEICVASYYAITYCMVYSVSISQTEDYAVLWYWPYGWMKKNIYDLKNGKRIDDEL